MGKKVTGRSFSHSGEKKARWHKELLTAEYFCTTYKLERGDEMGLMGNRGAESE